MSNEVSVQSIETGLRKNSLGFKDLFAQSVATIGPSGGPLVAIPMVALSAGRGTWISYLIAAIGVIFIGINIIYFARESSGTGSLSNYITLGLGSTLGTLGSWALVIAYVTCGASLLGPFVNYMTILLPPLGIPVSPYISIVLIIILTWFLAWKDVRLSERVMLYIELCSLLIGTVLVAIVLVKIGPNFDYGQFDVKSLSGSGVTEGTILAFMSLVGFESATMLGGEAKNPLKNIPKALVASILVAGGYYMISSYTMVSAFRFIKGSLTTSQAPVSDVANHFGLPALAILLTIGASVSAIAVVLASINASTRGLYLLSKQGILHKSISATHKTNKTPHVAVTIVSAIMLIIPVVLIFFKVGYLVTWSLIGSISTFGFLVAYLLVDIATPIYLYRKNKLKIRNIVLSTLGGISVLVPFVGSLYPVPAFPNNLLIYIFIVLLVAGLIIFLVQRRKNPSLTKDIAAQVSDTFNGYDAERNEQHKDSQILPDSEI